jgi:NitT/TauT family transport system substrate-binding protein
MRLLLPRRVRTAAALALAAVSAACGPRARERLTLGVVELPALGLVFIAAEKGYFEARGLILEQRRFATGRDAVAALGRGEVDAATAFETPVVLRAGADPELRVLSALHVSSRSTRLVARADRGIAHEGDLVGKRVGVPRDTNAESFLHALLEYGGVPAQQVVRVDVVPGEAAAALAAGDLDALAIWPPHAERARRLLVGRGAGAVEIGTSAYTELSMLVAREPTLARRRAAFVKLVQALADAERLVRERPGEALELLTRAFPGQPDVGEAWSRVRAGLGLSHQLAQVLETEWEWLLAEGRIGGSLDLGRLLAPEVLAGVDPEAVTFVSPPARSGATSPARGAAPSVPGGGG